MTQLTNTTIASTYGDVLTITNEGQGLANFLTQLQDGLGNVSPLSLSLTQFEINRQGGNEFLLDNVALLSDAENINLVAKINPILPGMGGVQIPAGETDQRLFAALPGAFRFNTESGLFEFFGNDDEWVDLPPGQGGNVVGPDISVAGNIAVFGDTTGKLIADSGITIGPGPIVSIQDINLVAIKGWDILLGNNPSYFYTAGTSTAASIFYSVNHNDHLTSPTSTTVFTHNLADPSSNSALIELNSNSQALLLSRTTTNLISHPINGMLLYNTSAHKLSAYINNQWINLSGAGEGGTVTEILTGTGLEGGPITTTGTISMQDTGVTPGTYSNATININPQGQVTFAEDGGEGGSVTEILTGTGLTGGPITTIGTISMADTAVIPGTYSNATININQQGQVIFAENGGGGAFTPGTYYFAEIVVSNLGFISEINQGGRDTTQTSPAGNIWISRFAGPTVSGGSYNIGIGGDVQKSITAAVGNIALGFSSQNAVTAAQYNVSVGMYSLNLNVTGDHSCSFGSFSLEKSTADSNSAFGYNSLNGNTTGIQNSGFGKLVLLNNKTGNNNTSAGFNSASSYQTYNNCTFLGVAADSSMTGLSNSMALGANSVVSKSNAVSIGNACTVGIGNNASDYTLSLGNINDEAGLQFIETVQAPSTPTIGRSGTYFYANNKLFVVNSDGGIYYYLPDGIPVTLVETEDGLIGGPITTIGTVSIDNSISSGTYQFGYGTVNTKGLITSAGRSGINMSGLGNLFVGTNAGNNGVTGSYNSSFGFLTLNPITTGSYNSFMGYLSGSLMTTGGFNCGYGSSALANISTASNCCALGSWALENVNDNFNSGMGSHSLQSVSAGDVFNTAIGTSSMNNIDSSYNTAVGLNSMTFMGSSTGFNVAIGHESGNVTGITNYSGNTMIGTFSDVSNSYVPQALNSTCIGYQSLIYAANAIHLGRFNASLTTANRVGIGTSSPAYTLSLGGTEPYMRLAPIQSIPTNPVSISVVLYLTSDQAGSTKTDTLRVLYPDGVSDVLSTHTYTV